MTRCLLVAAVLVAGCAELDPDASSLDPTRAIAVADGVDAIELVVTARSSADQPMPGRAVTLSVEGAATLSASSGKTDGAGELRVTLTSTRAEKVKLSASIDGHVLSRQPTVEFIPGAAARLAFASQPPHGRAGLPLSPAVTVELLDAYDNRARSSAPVTLTLSPRPDTLTGGDAHPASNGLATFEGLALSTPGTGYVLRATSPGLTDATSAPFDLTAGPVARVTFEVQPTNTIAGAALSPAPVVRLEDALGNLATGLTDEVLLDLVASNGAVLAGTTHLAPTDGRATFPALHVDRAGTGYRLRATAAQLLAESGSFDVAPAAPSELLVTATPDTATADGLSAISLRATLQDAFGNVLPAQTVTFSATGGENTLTQLSTTTASLTSTRAEGKTITAQSASLVGMINVTFTAGPPDSARSTLALSAPTAVAGSSVQLTFTARDAHGNPVPATQVSLSVSGSGHTLGATSGLTDTAGQFTTSLSSTRAEAKTVTATAGAATTQASVAFTPAAPSSTASSLDVTGSPARADGVAAVSLALTLRDAFSNVIAAAPVALSVSGTGNTLGAASGVTDASGRFATTLSSTRAEAKTVTATSGPASVQATATFVAGPSSSTHSTLVASGSPAVADGSHAVSLAFTARDAFDNAVAGLAVSLSVTGSGHTLTPSSGVSDAQGGFTATLTSTRAEGKIVTATFDLRTVQTPVVFVAGPAVQSQSTLSLATPLTAGVSAPLTVVARDAFGNPVANVAVTLSATGTGNGFGTTSGSTDTTGTFATTFSSTVAQAKVVTAQLGFSLTSSVSVEPAAPSAATSSLVAAPSTVVADGSSSALTATVRDAFSNVIAGATVGFTASGSATFVQPAAPTDGLGRATGSVSSLVPGTQTVTARVGAVSVATTSVVFSAPVSAGLSSVSVSPGVVAADGATPATVTVIVRDSLGAVMPGAAVTLAYSGTASILPASTTTNGAGVASFSVTATAPSTGALTATANAVTLATTPALDFRAVYSVGGAVSGLTTTGLVLATPTLPELSVPSGATSFTFVGLRPSGAAYDVTIRTQPANARCEVRSGKGLLQGANASVWVRCHSSWVSVAAGGDFTLALRADGTLWSFGSNASGQLGLGDTVDRAVPTLVGSGFTSISAGARHALALKSDGSLWAWGHNADGQLGLGDTTPRNVPVPVGPGFTHLAAGGRHSLAVKSDGTLWTWGANDAGQLGHGDVVPRNVPTRVTALGAGFLALAAGSSHSFAIQSGGTLLAWGDNGFGRLGVGDASPRLSPAVVGTGYAQVAAGAEHSLGLDTTHTLRAWGRNDEGQLGVTGGTQLTPVVVGSGYAAIAAAGSHSVALETGGTLRAWGRNESGQLGLKDVTSRASPTAVTTGVTAVAAGAAHVVSTKSDGTLWAQGNNTGAQLGLGDVRARWQPTRVGAWVALASGTYFTLALEADGSLWGFGNNTGTLGLGDTAQRPAPALIGTGYVAMAGGQDHTLALERDGTLWSFGQNGSGQLGVGDTSPRLTRALVGTGYRALAAGEAHSLGLRTDGTLWAWGRNDAGQLGLNDTTPRSAPTQLTGTWTAIAAGQRHSLGLRADGTLWAWGDNRFGQLGLGDSTQRSQPVQVGSGYRAVLAGGFHSLAFTTDGTLWAWGANDQGQVGAGGFGNYFTPQPLGTAYVAVGTNRGSTHGLRPDGALWSWGENSEGQLGSGVVQNQPVPVPSFSDVSLLSTGAGLHTVVVRADGSLWTSGYGEWGQLGRPNRVLVPGVRGPRFATVAASQLHSLGVAADGALWAWGDNSHGQLGVGDRLRRATPVQAGVGFSRVEGGSFHSVGLKTDGTLWAWGWNHVGQLGLGDLVDRGVPVQVGSGYSATCAGFEHTLGLRSDGTLWAWGNNGRGQLGVGDTTSRDTPTQVGAGYAAVACGDFHSLGLLSDGALRAWGSNASGQLGVGDTVDRLSPADAGVGYSVIAAASFSVALRTDGTLWWFGPGAGPTPVQLGTRTWVAVSAGNGSALALSADGSLWSWGYNGYGQLGLGEPGPRATPTLVGTGYSAMSMGASYALALEADGSLRAWGYDGYGQLGTAEVGQNFVFAPVP